MLKVTTNLDSSVGLAVFQSDCGGITRETSSQLRGKKPKLLLPESVHVYG